MKGIGRRPYGSSISIENDTLAVPGPLDTPCREWRWGKNQYGYGQVKRNGRKQLAHRVFYEMLRGPIPAGLTLDHLCRNHACCDQWHLEPVTQRENTLRGVGFAAVHARKTHCKRGHQYTPENTYVSVDNERYCRECARTYRQTPKGREYDRKYSRQRRRTKPEEARCVV